MKQFDPSLQVATYLRRELKRNHITQEKFAEKMHVEPRTVRRWLADGVCSIYTIFTIAEYFGLTDIGDIFSSENDVPDVFSEIGQKMTSKRSFFYVRIVNVVKKK